MDWITVLSIVFAVGGAAMLALGRRQYTRRRAFVHGSTVVTGTIVGLTENRDHDAISYFPTVRFQAASGSSITFQSEMGSSTDDNKIGDTVTVRYRPEQPHVAEIDAFMPLWGLTVLFGGLGVVFLFIGFAILAGAVPR
jgi:hypothetical protein